MKMLVIAKRLCAILMALSLVACSAPKIWLPRSGQVLDWETKEPIPEAAVIAYWQGSRTTLVDAQTICYHVDSAIADKEGRFTISAYTDGKAYLFDKHVFIFPYKDGYRQSIQPINGRNRIRQDKKEGLYYMEPDDRKDKERLRYLLHIGGLLDCGGYGNSEKEARVQVLKRLYDEAKGLVDGRESERLLEEFVYEASELLSRPREPGLSFDERNETIERAADRYFP